MSISDGSRLKAHLAPRDLALTLAIVVLLGFSFVPIKVGLREIPPFALAAVRFFLAAVPLVFLVKRPRIPWRYIVAYGFAICVCQFGLLFLGIKLGMPAGLASLVIQCQVFFTIGLGIRFLGDHFQRHNLVGAAIATAGIVLLGGYKLAREPAGTLVGFLLVIVAAFAWSIGNIVAKRAAGEHQADMFGLVVWSSLVAPLPLAAMSYALEGGPAAWYAVVSASALTWGCVLYLAWGATLTGFAVWARLMHRYPTALIAPFTLLMPVSGLASAVWLLGETLAPLQMAGVALVFAGLLENTYGARLRESFARRRR